MAHEVMVRKDGGVIERGPVEQVLAAPRHPYTCTLVLLPPESQTILATCWRGTLTDIGCWCGGATVNWHSLASLARDS
jgi:ABC-type dipeptide/oligopeptide/nickel transport system ATPase component